MRLTRTLAALAFALTLSCLSTPAQDQSSTGDPVADAARKAREEKKVAPKPKKVFTDDDVAPKRTETPAPAATSANPAGSPPVAEGTSTKPSSGKMSGENENPNSEKAWRKRFADQRQKIADAELELDVLQREAQKADIQYYSDPQKAMKEQFTRNEINEKNAKIEEKKKQIADLKQKLSDLEDQLRSSGGDAGWAR